MKESDIHEITASLIGTFDEPEREGGPAKHEEDGQPDSGWPPNAVEREELFEQLSEAVDRS